VRPQRPTVPCSEAIHLVGEGYLETEHWRVGTMFVFDRGADDYERPNAQKW
jgi:hypothetical protein